MRKLYVWLNERLGRHILAKDCWCHPAVDSRYVDPE